MPISSGANGWPVRHFKKTPSSEPKLKKFVNVMPRDPYYPTAVKPPRPPSPAPNPVFFYTPTSDRRIRPSPSPPLTPEPRRKPRYSPPSSPEPRRKQPSSEDGCCGAGGACGSGCCTRMCSNSVCCWADDAYRRFSQRGRPIWWSRDGGKPRGCCANRCCRIILACLLGLLFLLLLIALILALVFGVPAYNRRSTVTIINGKNYYMTVLGKYQNCTDPTATTTTTSLLPLCNTTTVSWVTTPAGFVPPYRDPPASGQSRAFPVSFLYASAITVMISLV